MIRSRFIPKPIDGLPIRYTRALCRRYLGFYISQAYVRLHPDLLHDDRPMIVGLNHQAFWDGWLAYLATIQLNRNFRVHGSTQVLRAYPLLGVVGMVPAWKGDPQRSSASLREQAMGLVDGSRRCLWIFPQGRYERIPSQGSALLSEHDARFAKCRWGVTELLRLQKTALFVPAAVRYDFIRYRQPAAFLDLGRPRYIPVDEYISDGSRRDLVELLAKLMDEQSRSLRRGIIDEPAAFRAELRRESALVAGQHLEFADIARQIYGIRGVQHAFVTKSDISGMQVNIRIRGTEGLGVESVGEYLLEKYEVDRPDVREAFLRQVVIDIV